MKKVVLIVAVTFFSVTAFSQVDESLREKKMTFGFNLGGFQTLINPDQSSSNNIEINNSSGFRLGVLMNYKLGKKFSISPKAELGF